MRNPVILLIFVILVFSFTGCEKVEKPSTEEAKDTKTEQIKKEAISESNKAEDVISEAEEKAEEVESEAVEKSEQMHEEQIEKQEQIAPDRIAKELWELIHREEYRINWQMWPGKPPFYNGSHPHGALLTTYLNEQSYNAVVNKEGEMPPGSIIIKENYDPEKNLGAITVLYKLAGFDPENNNWFWVKFAPDGVPMTMDKDGKSMTLAGKVPGCIGCHGARKENDYIYTGSLK